MTRWAGHTVLDLTEICTELCQRLFSVDRNGPDLSASFVASSGPKVHPAGDSKEPESEFTFGSDTPSIDLEFVWVVMVPAFTDNTERKLRKST